MYPAGECPGSPVLIQEHFQQEDKPAWTLKAESSRDILFPELSYLNHGVALEEECPWDGSAHHGSHSSPAEGSCSAARPRIPGRGNGRSRDLQPCQANNGPCWAMAMPLLPQFPLVHISVEIPEGKEALAEMIQSAGRDNERMLEGREGRRRVVKAYAWKPPGATVLWNPLVSFIFRVEMWLSVGHSHSPLQSPKPLSVGFSGTEAVVQLHPAYAGISVYSHKPTTHVLLSGLLVTRHTRNTYEAGPIQKKNYSS